jgi:DNA-binding PadR family transcriptional regulator
MRWALDTAEPARHALLGLLLDGPRHGYDLARHFAPGTALGDVMHLGASHLYALLARLERDGLVTAEIQAAGARPNRRVYSLTEAGRAAAQRWIDEPVARPRDALLDFPLKFYLALRLDPARAAALLENQRALFSAYVQRLEEEGRQPGAGDDAAFIALVRQGRIARTRAILEWLSLCEKEVAAASR